jgi:hypothetical protein
VRKDAARDAERCVKMRKDEARDAEMRKERCG